jgi:hypothetical protein
MDVWTLWVSVIALMVAGTALVWATAARKAARQTRRQAKFLARTRVKRRKSARPAAVLSPLPADNAKETLRTIITDSLTTQYISYSCKEAISTGNHYQTIKLNGCQLDGFRANRDSLLDAINFTGMTVLDIGSNLGEITREAYRRGSAKAHGLEYDAYYLLVAKLINLYDGIPGTMVSFERIDVTKEYLFEKPYDITLAFSTFTYIGHRLADVARSTRRFLFVETHAIRNDQTLGTYVSTITPHFPLVLIIGESDWGKTGEFADGHRAVLVCFHRREEFSEFVLECQRRKPLLTSLREINIRQSNFEVFRQLANWNGDGSSLAQIAEAMPIHEAMDIAYPSSTSHLAYWLEFWRGHLTAKREGRVTADNPYVRAVRDYLSKAILFDPAITTPTTDDATLFQRCEARLKLFDADEHDPIVLFNRSPSLASFEVVDIAERRLPYTSCDGHHRLAVDIFRGKETARAYYFQVFDQTSGS